MTELPLEVWFILVRLRRGSATNFPGSENALIYVEAYVPSYDLYDALKKCEQTLASEGYTLQRFERCIRFSLDDWDFDEYPEDSEARGIVERLLQRNEVEFGPFCFSD